MEKEVKAAVHPPQKIRGRFAPTPSGRMHLGNLLCGLLAWLSAHSQGGEMVLRIEDLDRERCPQRYADLLREDLLWAGLTWEEGPGIGGPHMPYFQSQRTEFYLSCFHHLEKMGLMYPCFCSRAELHTAQAPHLSDGRVIYSGRCKKLTSEQLKEKRRRRSPAFRLQVPNQEESFHDLHYGLVRQNLQTEFGDALIRRSDGVFAYQLAAAADDGEMGITQVVRGSDLLSSTPIQRYLLRLLGYPLPEYGHIPLLLDSKGQRLSKRDQSMDLGELRRRFPSPEPLLGRLGHLCGFLEKPEPVTAFDLLEVFSWEKLPKTDLRLPAVFNFLL